MLDKERRDSIIGIASDLVAQGIGPEHDRACYLRLTENRAGPSMRSVAGRL
jgi:hypothetical protein